MATFKLRGTGVALVTPFKDNQVDYPALANIIEYVINGGVDYLVALGSTGETATLNDTEARSILDFIIKKNAGRKPLVAGNFGGNNTMELARKISTFNFDGIDAILSSSPEYVKPNQQGIYQHFMAIAEVSPVPIILYNVPSRTNSNMSWDTTVRLAKASNVFIGIKEATGDLIQATRIIKNRPEGFEVVSGDDEVALPLIACGGEGVISVMANALPGTFSHMIKAALDDNYAMARKLNMLSYDLHHWLYVEGNPVGVKSALEVLGLCHKDVRLPLSVMSDDNYAHLKKSLMDIMSEMKNQ